MYPKFVSLEFPLCSVSLQLWLARSPSQLEPSIGVIVGCVSVEVNAGSAPHCCGKECTGQAVEVWVSWKRAVWNVQCWKEAGLPTGVIT